MSNNTQPPFTLSHDEAFALDEHLLEMTHHLIEVKWAIRKAMKAETYTGSDVRTHLFSALKELTFACQVFEPAHTPETAQ
jgi:hypothetical protein